MSTEALAGEPAAGGGRSLADVPLDTLTAASMAAGFKALADPTRLVLMSHIAARGRESVCACDLLHVVDVSQPTVSHHLGRLVDAGLLVRERRGRWAHYAVAVDALERLRGFLDLS